MENNNRPVIAASVHKKISSMLILVNEDIADLLEQELNRASIVSDDRLPKDVVTINSTVTFQDIENNKEVTVRLVFPHEADINHHKVSILTPVGSALIGLRVGHVIDWPFPDGKNRKLKVIKVDPHLEG